MSYQEELEIAQTLFNLDKIGLRFREPKSFKIIYEQCNKKLKTMININFQTITGESTTIKISKAQLEVVPSQKFNLITESEKSVNILTEPLVMEICLYTSNPDYSKIIRHVYQIEPFKITDDTIHEIIRINSIQNLLRYACETKCIFLNENWMCLQKVILENWSRNFKILNENIKFNHAKIIDKETCICDIHRYLENNESAFLLIRNKIKKNKIADPDYLDNIRQLMVDKGHYSHTKHFRNLVNNKIPFVIL